MKIVIATLLLLSAAFAQAATPWGDAHQQRQHWRIERGIAIGVLSRPEARVLRWEQGQLRRLQWRIRADGVVTLHERDLLLRRQHQAGRHIARFSRSQRCRY